MNSSQKCAIRGHFYVTLGTLLRYIEEPSPYGTFATFMKGACRVSEGALINYIAAKPVLISAMISSIFSSPTENLIIPPSIPAATSCSSVS